MLRIQSLLREGVWSALDNSSSRSKANSSRFSACHSFTACWTSGSVYPAPSTLRSFRAWKVKLGIVGSSMNASVIGQSPRRNSDNVPGEEDRAPHQIKRVAAGPTARSQSRSGAGNCVAIRWRLVERVGHRLTRREAFRDVLPETAINRAGTALRGSPGTMRPSGSAGSFTCFVSSAGRVLGIEGQPPEMPRGSQRCRASRGRFDRRRFGAGTPARDS